METGPRLLLLVLDPLLLLLLDQLLHLILEPLVLGPPLQLILGPLVLRRGSSIDREAAGHCRG